MLCTQPLFDVYDNALTYGVPWKFPEPQDFISAFNFSLMKMKEELVNPTLSTIVWPPPEFAHLEGTDVNHAALPPMDWNSMSRLKQISSLLDQLLLPGFTTRMTADDRPAMHQSFKEFMAQLFHRSSEHNRLEFSPLAAQLDRLLQDCMSNRVTTDFFQRLQ